MTRTHFGPSLLALTIALGAPACGPAAAQNDASTGDAVAADSSGGDASGGDGGSCEDLSGSYELTGTCSVPGFAPFPSACIAQTGCSATISVLTGTITGTVRGNQVSFSTALGAISLACTATRQDGRMEVHCEAADVGATCDAQGTPADFPGATRYCCDVRAQDCGAGQRCNVVSNASSNNTLTTACIPAGSLAAGAVCTRANGRVGDEQCGAGQFCSNVAQSSPTSRVCQRLCRSGSECGDGQNCILLTQAPRAGTCSRRCSIGGTECGAGMTCRSREVLGMSESDGSSFGTFCDPVGPSADGSGCMFNTECGPNSTCVRRTGSDPLTCRPTCDPAHACPSGTTCNPFNGGANPAGLGFCAPTA